MASEASEASENERSEYRATVGRSFKSWGVEVRHNSPKGVHGWSPEKSLTCLLFQMPEKRHFISKFQKNS